MSGCSELPFFSSKKDNIAALFPEQERKALIFYEQRFLHVHGFVSDDGGVNEYCC